MKKIGLVALVFVVLALLGGPAAAHVSVKPSSAQKGGFEILSFSVPNEKDDANTVQLEVDIPTKNPIPSVSVQPMPGWTITTQKTTLAKPVQTDDGEVTEAISEVAWKSTGGGIKPGQFGQFVLSVGPLPKADSMTFKVIQSYSDRSQVPWIEVAAPGSNAEPEHPAPVLELSPASGSARASAAGAVVTAEPKKQSQTGPVVLGIVALAVAVAAAVAAALALVRSRRQTGERA